MIQCNALSIAGEGSTEPLLDLTSPFWCAIFAFSEVNMVDVAQLVSASDCGSEGRGFDSHHPPQKRDTFGYLFYFPSHSP